jgi:hypothetical protein
MVCPSIIEPRTHFLSCVVLPFMCLTSRVRIYLQICSGRLNRISAPLTELPDPSEKLCSMAGECKDSTVSMSIATKYLDGRRLLCLVESRARRIAPDLRQRRVVVLRFGWPREQRVSEMRASELSLGEKILALGRVGCAIDYRAFPFIRNEES